MSRESVRSGVAVNGLEVVEQRRVGPGRGVVELVDDDDVELPRVERLKFPGGERLDRCEHMVPAAGLVASNPEFTEAAVLEDVSKGCPGSFQDLLAVRHEQQP